MTAFFYAENKKRIDEIILSMKNEFLLEREEDLARFLDIQIERNKQNNKITLTQTGLTDRILETMDMKDWNLKYTPADKDPLRKDLDREPCCEEWDYRSIVGMMLYLAESSQLDIFYDVHNVPGFPIIHEKVTRLELNT